MSERHQLASSRLASWYQGSGFESSLWYRSIVIRLWFLHLNWVKTNSWKKVLLFFVRNASAGQQWCHGGRILFSWSQGWGFDSSLWHYSILIRLLFSHLNCVIIFLFLKKKFPNSFWKYISWPAVVVQWKNTHLLIPRVFESSLGYRSILIRLLFSCPHSHIFYLKKCFTILVRNASVGQ